MKKISKTAIISFVFFVFFLIATLIYSFFFKTLPPLIESTKKSYKLLSALKLTCTLLPAVFATSSMIGFCIDFGKNPINARLRFSDAIFSKYKNVIISSLIFVFIITAATEIFLPVLNFRLKNYEKQPTLLNDFYNSAKLFFESGEYETALQYAKQAEKIDPQNEENNEILYKIEAELNQSAQISSSLKEKLNELTFKELPLPSNKDLLTPKTAPYESYELLQTARECLKQQDWFGAHYYSQMAMRSSNEKDININEMKRISAQAWNKISETKIAQSTDSQKIFAKKYSGYVALINGEILRAYYIFHTLSLQSKELAIDPDIERYLSISKKALENQYFFTDETKDLQTYENFHNVYFKLKDKNTGITTLYFIRGITTLGNGTNMIQYLRGTEIVNLDSEGMFESGFFVPYAKLTCMQTEYFDEEIKNLLQIDSSLKNVPYILLNSVDRNFPDQMISPEFTGGYKLKNLDGFLILNMPFSDFELIEYASNGVESMNLFSVFNFVKKAETYGFSEDAFGQFLMNRMFNPLYLLILFIFVAWLSWHFRIEEDSVFKFKWIIMFPLLAIIYIGAYKIAICFYKFINYGLLGISGLSQSLLLGTGFYIFMLILVSILFLSCRNDSNSN